MRTRTILAMLVAGFSTVRAVKIMVKDQLKEFIDAQEDAFRRIGMLYNPEQSNNIRDLQIASH